VVARTGRPRSRLVSGQLTWQQRAWAALLAVGPGVLHGPSAVRAALGPCRSVDDRADIVVAVFSGDCSRS